MFKILGIGALVVLTYMTLTDQAEERNAQIATENAIHEQAVDIRNKQIDEANVKAEQLIASANDEQKACLQLPGVSTMSQVYKKAEACHIGKFDIEGLHFIKQKISG
mgnify:CR=1 FL=1|tara:strand:- start:90 stop:410 length:321 start_codon:yes stop_codon:yes gene_type:complete